MRLASYGKERFNVMKNASDRFKAIKRIAIPIGVLLFLGPMLAVADLMNRAEAFGIYIRVLIALQLIIAIFFLVFSTRLSVEDKKAIKWFRYSCYACLCYAIMLGLSMFYKSYLEFGVSPVVVISSFMVVIIVSIPFAWCLKALRL